MKNPGILLSFVAAFFSISGNHILYGFKTTIYDGDLIKSPNYILLIISLLLALRHQLRIVFIDDMYASHLLKKSIKMIWWLIFLVAVMGPMSLSIFGYGNIPFAIYMFSYSILFTILGIYTLVSVLNESEVFNNIYPPLVVDVLLSVSWLIVLISVIWHGRKFTDLPEALPYVLILTIMAALAEYMLSYRPPVKKKFELIRQLLINKNC